jgi:hypothetical protein
VQVSLPAAAFAAGKAITNIDERLSTNDVQNASILFTILLPFIFAF